MVLFLVQERRASGSVPAGLMEVMVVVLGDFLSKLTFHQFAGQFASQFASQFA